MPATRRLPGAGVPPGRRRLKPLGAAQPLLRHGEERVEKAGWDRETAGWTEEKKGTRIRENREERQMDFPKGLYAISQNCRDLLVKQNFPSIQNPNGEMPKMKVGEFFKLYNIALGPKFKNLKFTSLHAKFWTKVGFELLLS
jgi:hypothetical protein